VALFERGGLNVGRIFGVQLRLHWSTALGPLVFTGLRFDTVDWACFFGLLLAHELGHVIAVKAAGARPTLVEVTGYGGRCQWRGDVSPSGRAAIAWGGVLAQLALLAAALAYVSVFGIPLSHVAVRAFSTLTDANLWLIAVNLVPLPVLDGLEAWRLPILLGRALRGSKAGAAMPEVPTGPAHAHDEAFEAGARRDEVKAIVSDLLDEARKE
jgi:Zn-dependent protease